MQKTTKRLSDEHKNILKLIEILDKECNELESGKKINESFLREIIFFIKNYADKFHHAKEEDILFKELCKPETKMHCNPVEQMLHEHKQGRSFVKGVEDGLEEDNKNKIIENARGYVNLLREHIYKEDNILYPMADEALNKKTQESISEKFKEIDKIKKEIKQKCLLIIKK